MLKQMTTIKKIILEMFPNSMNDEYRELRHKNDREQSETDAMSSRQVFRVHLTGCNLVWSQ
jgi:hypothetical protein